MNAPTPREVVPLMADLGSVAGQQVVLLSLEVWDSWADLRFARLDVGADRPLQRRVPATSAWTVAVGGQQLEVVDAVGRGDRHFSNGEVRLRPAPTLPAMLEVSVEVVAGTPPLTGAVLLRSGG